MKTNEERIEKTLSFMAVGNVSDAVKLLMHGNDLTEKQLRRLKLENVACIKKGTGGVTEIKFCDRLKALQCLMAYEKQGDKGNAFLSALLNSTEGDTDDDE